MNMFEDSSLPKYYPGSNTATFPQGLLAKPEEKTPVDKAVHRHRPILVTGSHYAGTTWIGKMLALAPEVGYIHEPFHPKHSKGICASEFQVLYEFLAPRATSYQADIEQMLAFKYQFWKAVGKTNNIGQLKKNLADYLRFTQHRLGTKRALLKAPYALFSTDWLAKTFNMDVVVVVRHPAAFAGSLKASGYRTPFNSFINQPELMREHLAPFDAQIQKYAWQAPDIIDEAILIWRMVHLVILRYVHYHPNWIFVRHEDLSRNPLSSFGRIYKALGLEYTGAIQRIVEEHSSSKHAATGREAHDIKRNSLANLHTWSKRLNDSEILRVKDGTEDFASHFYNDEDWLHG